jgi:hypothetical protein
MIVNDIVEMASVCYGSNQNALNVMHLKVTAITGTGLTLQQLCTLFEAAWGPVIKPALPNAWSFHGIKCRSVFPIPTAVVTSAAVAGAGTLGAGDLLPPQTAAVITIRASTAPPRTRGRLYLPPATEAENFSTGVPTAAYATIVGGITTYLTAAHTYTAGGDSATCSFVIYHRKVPQTAYPVTSASMRGFWGTQRRRSAINRNDVPAL